MSTSPAAPVKLAATPTPIPRGSGASIADSVMAVLDKARGATPPPAQPNGEPPAEPVAAAPAPAPAPAPALKPDAMASLVPDDVLGAQAPAPVVAADHDDDGTEEPVPASIARDEKANVAFAKLRADYRKATAALKAKEAEIERLAKTQTPELGEIQELRNKLAESEERIGKYDLAATSEFRNRFDSRMEHALQKGLSVLVRSGKSPDEARALVTKLTTSGMNMQQIQDAIADEPFAVQGALVSSITEFADIADERQAALAKWKDTQAALSVQEKRRNEIQLMENVERDTEAAMQEVLKSGNWMYARSADNEEWNKQVEARVRAVKGLMRSGKTSELVSMILEGVTAKDTRELFKAAHARTLQLQQQIQELVQATPSLARRAGAPGGIAPSGPRKPQSVSEVLTGLLG